MIAPGDILTRADTGNDLLHVAVLSNTIHIAANTGRLIVCPFIPGTIPADTMAMVVPVPHPAGTLLPELVQWLPAAALGPTIGNVGGPALARARTTATALIAG